MARQGSSSEAAIEQVLELCIQSQSMIDITADKLFALRRQLQSRAIEELIKNEIRESEVRFQSYESSKMRPKHLQSPGFFIFTPVKMFPFAEQNNQTGQQATGSQDPPKVLHTPTEAAGLSTDSAMV